MFQTGTSLNGTSSVFAHAVSATVESDFYNTQYPPQTTAGGVQGNPWWQDIAFGNTWTTADTPWGGWWQSQTYPGQYNSAAAPAINEELAYAMGASLEQNYTQQYVPNYGWFGDYRTLAEANNNNNASTPANSAPSVFTFNPTGAWNGYPDYYISNTSTPWYYATHHTAPWSVFADAAGNSVFENPVGIPYTAHVPIPLVATSWNNANWLQANSSNNPWSNQQDA